MALEASRAFLAWDSSLVMPGAGAKAYAGRSSPCQHAWAHYRIQGGGSVKPFQSRAGLGHLVIAGLQPC